jgi:Ca-activated chloride channel family protein
MTGRVPWHAVVAFLLATLGTIGAAAVTDPPREPWGWVLFVLSVMAVTGAGTLALYVGLSQPADSRQAETAQGDDAAPDDPAPAPVDRHSWWRKVLLIVLVLVLTGGLWYVCRPLLGRVEVLLFGCEHPTQVRVLTAPELLETYRILVDRYERVAAERNDDCRPAELHVYAPPIAKGREGLMAGWSQEYLRDSGPRPDIWLPETSVHVAEVRDRQKLTGFGPDLGQPDSIASTPIVLGMPIAAGVRHDDERWQGQTWATLVGNLETVGAGLIRAAPGVSTVGEFGTVAIYTSEDRAVGQREDPSLAREFERWVDRSLAADGYPADGDTVALLRARSATEPPGPAVVLSELALVRFNQGVRHRSGRGCNVPNGPADCLLAFYPSDTHRLDLPFVRLRWRDEPASAAQQAAAEDFGTWLKSDDGRRALVGVGLRPPGTRVTEPLTEAQGVLPGAPQLYPARDNPPPAVRAETMAVHELVRRPGKVLISLDASGSMRQPVDDRNTRFTVALDAVRAAADGLAAADVQFAVFSQTIGVAPIGRDDLAGVRPTGNTPLYRAIVDGVRLVGPGGVLVVVTDGVNNVGDVSPQQLVDLTGQGGVRVLVLTFGEGNCSAQALLDVASRTGGSCRQSTVDSLRPDLDHLLQGR